MKTPPMLQPQCTADAIAKGLVRTGRAKRPEPVGDMIRLERKAGGFYWISFDGGELRQGVNLLDAEPLQPTFVAAMVRAGRS